MPTYAAFLRAINVGGTGKLPMADLRRLCEQLGFRDVRTYIQSGNVVCTTPLSASAMKTKLEKALASTLGQPCRVLIRTIAELEDVLKRNPFADAEPNRVIVVLLDEPQRPAAMATVKIPGRERLDLQGRELFIHFPDGQGRSKLKVPFADSGTGRNINTIRAVLDLARRPA